MTRSARAMSVLGFVIAVTLAPRPALAHAAFVSSDPEPGATLPTAPVAVTLHFTEPVNQALSRVAVTPPDGKIRRGGASGPTELQVIVTDDLTGAYRVEWTTVSTIDGHTLRGSFRFGVRVDPGGGADASTVSGPVLADLLLATARAGEYLALLLAVGMVVVSFLASRPSRIDWVAPRLRLALWVALGSGIVVVIGEAVIAASGLHPGSVVAFLTTGSPGVARMTRIGLEATALVAVARGWRIAVAALAGALITLAASGHAAAVRPMWWGITVDALHLVAAGAWAGGILSVATLRPPGGWRGERGRLLLARFAPTALVAFGLTVLTGVLRSTHELDGWRDLLTTSYGVVLGFKIAAVAAMVPLSFLTWRRVIGSPRLEAGVVLGVIAAAALLAAYPLPPGRSAEAEERRTRTGGPSALPVDGDLTMADGAGTFLVGLTLRPGRPGRNTVLIYVLPLEGPDAAVGVPVLLRVDGRPVDVRQCGGPCREGRVVLRGGERMEIEVPATGGGTARFVLPMLPAPPGAEPFAQAQASMHALSTYRLTEEFGPGEPPVRSLYAFEAPDRMTIDASNGYRSVFIGGTRYQLVPGGGGWQVERGAPPVEVPSFVWDFPDLQAPHIVDLTTLDGNPVTVISVFGMSGETPIWFRLWTDPEGLVRKAEMRAQGHFMDHRYSAFDEELEIEPPPAADP